MAKRPLEDGPEVEVRSCQELRDWLERHQGQSTGVWLVTHKKSEAPLHLPYEEVVLACLAFGWVDSLSRIKDERRSVVSQFEFSTATTRL